MLIVTAVNVTPEGLQDQNGKAQYDVWMGINHRCIWRGSVQDHVRDAGAAELLRRIANTMDSSAGQTVPE